MANPLRMIGKTAPPRSPERTALAAAIELHSNAERGRDATERALSEARARIYRDSNAVEAVEKAKAGVEEAKANAVRHMTDTLLGNAGAAPVTVKQARLELQAAEDELEALQTMKTALEARMKACDEELYWAKNKLDDAVKKVAQSEPGIRNLVAKFMALKSELEQRRFDLSWLWCQGVIPDDLKNYDAIGTTHVPLPDALSEGTAPWKAALDELAVNSDAPLPAVS